MRRLIISADDFGYAPAYDSGILEAARAGALDAVSVMVRRGDLDARSLRAAGVELGLHLELGERSAAGDSDRDRARASLLAQLDEFERTFGRPAAFLDGHRHCHARHGVAAQVGRLGAERALVVRSVDTAHRRLLRRLGVATPDLLVGRLEESQPALPAELEALLTGEGAPGGIVEWMVHPGHADPSSGSGYDAGREEDLSLVLDLLDSRAVRRLRASHAAALGA